jgi:uncharacterized protein (TIGR03000 family)
VSYSYPSVIYSAPASGGTVIEQQSPTLAPDEPTTGEMAPSPNVTDETRNLPADSGLLTIQVPAEATVFVNGLKTKSTGANRSYVSHGLKPGFSYKYEVRAVVTRGKTQVEDSKVVYLTAGATEGIAFDFLHQPQHQLAGLR